MAINWFPGHMHKARKEIRKVMSEVDIVIEILDARIPFSSTNPLVNGLRGDKPLIKILNKADLADEMLTQQWQTHFEQDSQTRTLALSANQDSRKSTIASLCRKLVTPRASDKNVHAMIMGIPNVGKSTLINALAGKTIAKVGNEPAVTRRQQKIKLDNGLTLSDTPGILWPKLEPASCAYRLAATGAIKDTAMEYDDVALTILAFLREHYSEALLSRYRLQTLSIDAMDILEQIGAKRGCLRSGGVVDIHQAATIVLQELRSGKLGRITLETPDMMQTELDQLREEIAKRKALREKPSGPHDSGQEGKGE